MTSMSASFSDVGKIFGILREETRLKILFTLKDGPMTAGQVEQAIGRKQSTTSVHLGKLREAKLIVSKQKGKHNFYKIRDPQVFDLLQAVNAFATTTALRENGLWEKPAKILFLGLDGSGKTSIILSLQGDRNLLDFAKIGATMGRAIEQVPVSGEPNVIYWEAGGQLSYRREFLAKPGQYLERTKKIVFVIDVQNHQRDDEAFGYLAQVIDILEKRELLRTLDLSVHLHKFDPNLWDHPAYTHPTIEGRFLQRLKDLVPATLPYQVFRSTVFTKFRRELLWQVSRP